MPNVFAHYPAVVTFNQDPDKRGVIRVACAAIMGDEDTEVPVDVEPAHDWGWFYVPDIGEVVEVEVMEHSAEDEHPGQASIAHLDIKWRSARFFGNTEGATPTPVNTAFTEEHYGKRRGFATPAGHVLMFDDADGGEEIRLWWKDGGASVVIDKDGTITLTNKSGATFTMDATADKIVASATSIEIDGSAEAAVLGTTFKTYFDAHTHPTPFGPSGPPVTPMPSNTLSTKVTVG